MKDDIAEVRVQDQVLLAAGLEALLAERSAPLKEKNQKHKRWRHCARPASKGLRYYVASRDMLGFADTRPLLVSRAEEGCTPREELCSARACAPANACAIHKGARSHTTTLSLTHSRTHCIDTK
jgi:hypothetical protein